MTVEVVTPLVVTETFWLARDAFAAITNVAVIVVVLVTFTFVAVMPMPLKLIMAGVKKFVPVSVTGTFALSSPFVGEIDVSVGGAATVNVWLIVVPPAVITITPCAPSGAPAAIWNVAVMVLPLVTVVPTTVIPVPGVTRIVLAPTTKLVPVSVTLTLVPWIPLVGLSEVSVGNGGLTVNGTVVVVMPLVVTETFWLLSGAFAAITNVAVIVVVLVAFTFVAVMPVPLKLIVAGLKKFVPVSVTGTLALSSPLVGLMEASVGGGATVNVWLPEVPPKAVTVTFCATSGAFAATWKTEVMVMLFTSTTLVGVTPVPLRLMVIGATKAVPVSVTLTLVPWIPLVGLTEVSVGGGGFTVKVWVGVVPPGVMTLMFCPPSAAVALI
jgi:hypothetical protein